MMWHTNCELCRKFGCLLELAKQTVETIIEDREKEALAWHLMY